MPTSFEELVFSIIATDKGASAAFDRFRQKVDQTSKSVDDNTKKLDENSKSIDKVGKSAAASTPLLGSLAGTGGMGLLIGAGVALSPIIATVGAGLVGLGAAAFGAVSPVMKAAQAAGGLQANMTKLGPEQQKLAVSILGLGKQYGAFEKALQPQVLGIFGQGIKIAGHLMGDLTPIAKNTGVALEQVLGRIDAEFKSGTWQQFFGFMATQAGPDVKLLGNLIIDLTKTLPPLLQDLQPVAVGLLKLADAAVKAADGYASFIKAEAHKGNQPGTFGHQIVTLFKDLTRLKVVTPQAAAEQTALNKRFADGRIAAADLIHPIGTFTSGLTAAQTATMNETTAVALLTTALAGMNTGLLTTEQDQVAWKQAQKAATAAINANTGSLDGNSAAALAARSALIQTTVQALAFANQEVKVHHNTDAASKIIRDQIRYLQTHAGKSKIAKDEIDALRLALAKLAKTPPIHESIFMTGKGRWGIFGQGQGQGSIFGSGKGATLATGGRVPGYGGGDRVPALLEGGEAVVPKHLTAALAPFLKAHGVPGFAAGGIVPSYGGGVGAPFRNWTTGNWNASIKSIEHSMGNAMASTFQRAIQSMQVSGFGTGVGQWAGLVRRVLGMEGLPFGDAGVILSQIATESGGNPNAINLTDSNAAAGDPSRGLLQTIGSTFAAYHWPGTSWNIYDPLANVAAGVNYAVHRYGNPGFLSVLGHGHGYDSGGWLPPGASLAYNGTGQPERVLPPGRGSGPVMVVEHLHVREAADVDLLARRLAFLDS